MACRLCQWLCKWFCGPEASSEAFWRASSEWEESNSNAWELWMADDEAVQAALEHAIDISETDPRRALQLRKDMAEKGSATAMLHTGWHYEAACGTARDLALAEHYYRQAVIAGSWMATLRLARLLFHHQINENWIRILQDGVDCGFIPASYWLAWYRYKRSPRRQTAAEVRPLMEQAGAAGHPGARLTLARWKGLGTFGLGEMRAGSREMVAIMHEARSRGLRDSAAGAEPAPTPETWPRP